MDFFTKSGIVSHVVMVPSKSNNARVEDIDGNLPVRPET
jgi:hypothetical protein